MYEKICKSCGQKFTTRDNRTEYCKNKECQKQKNRDKYAKRLHSCICQQCGKEFLATDKQNKEYCKHCRTNKPYKYKKQYLQTTFCKICGKEINKTLKNYTNRNPKKEILGLCIKCKEQQDKELRDRVSLRMKLKNPSYTKHFTSLEEYNKHKEKVKYQKSLKRKINLQNNRERMKKNNPMFDSKIRIKVSKTLRERKEKGLYKNSNDGTKRKNYKGNRGIKRYLRIELYDWRKISLKQANYECQLCHKKNTFLNIHHVVPFDYIVSYFAKKNNIDLNKIEYKSSEFNLLKNEILNFHYNNSIALVVCEDCHDKVDKNFHKQKNLSVGGIKKYYETK